MKRLLLVCLIAGLSLGATPRKLSVRDAFRRQTGHPHGWPGHVVDHIVPLCAGGPDAVENMQWQTVAEGKQKDRFERELCAFLAHTHLRLVP